MSDTLLAKIISDNRTVMRLHAGIISDGSERSELNGKQSSVHSLIGSK